MTTNPYRYNRPGHHYVGDLPSRIIERMLVDHEHFGIVGGRRCGKTSIIRVLERELRRVRSVDVGRAVIPVTIDVTDFDHVAPGVVFRRILEALTAGLEGYCWDSYVEDPEPYRSFRQHVGGPVGRDLTRRHGSNWIVAILIDEVDNLAGRLHQAGHGDTLFGNLRNLLSDPDIEDSFRLVLTGVSDPEGTINRGSPFNILAKQRLGILTYGNLDKLIGIGFQDGIGSDARNRLVELTGRHPYLVQALLQKLWRVGGAGIGRADVDWAADSFLKEHTDFRRWLNVFDGPARRVYGYLSAYSPQSASKSDLPRALELGDDVDPALDVLMTHGVIELDGEHCRISGTMFRDWYASHAPVAASAVDKILDQLQADIAGRLDIAADERRRAQELVATARSVLTRDANGNPGAARKEGSTRLQKTWQIVKGGAETAALVETLVKLAPYLGTAAAWIPKLIGVS